MNNRKSQNLAFTLAEVLITLGIIGVVASMTLPILMNNVQAQQFETGIKKFYSTISQAVRAELTEEGVSKVTHTDVLYCDDDLTSEQCGEKAETFIKKHFKVIKDCNDPRTCFGTSYTESSPNSEIHLSGVPGVINTKDGTVKHGSCKILADGSTICVQTGDSTWSSRVTVDLNGPKGPNKNGYDLFSFAIYHNGTIDEMSPECKNGDEDAYCPRLTSEDFNDACIALGGVQYGAGCFAHLLRNGFKIDY